jgi:hypothetical protein
MTNQPTPVPFGVFHNAETGEYIIRDLTPQEIAAIPNLEPRDETPSPA